MLFIIAVHAGVDEYGPRLERCRRLLLPHAHGGRHGRFYDEYVVSELRRRVDHAVRVGDRGGVDHAGDDGPADPVPVHVRPHRGTGARTVRPGEFTQ